MNASWWLSCPEKDRYALPTTSFNAGGGLCTAGQSKFNDTLPTSRGQNIWNSKIGTVGGVVYKLIALRRFLHKQWRLRVTSS